MIFEDALLSLLGFLQVSILNRVDGGQQKLLLEISIERGPYSTSLFLFSLGLQLYKLRKSSSQVYQRV